MRRLFLILALFIFSVGFTGSGETRYHEALLVQETMVSSQIKNELQDIHDAANRLSPDFFSLDQLRFMRKSIELDSSLP